MFIQRDRKTPSSPPPSKPYPSQDQTGSPTPRARIQRFHCQGTEPAALAKLKGSDLAARGRAGAYPTLSRITSFHLSEQSGKEGLRKPAGRELAELHCH